jgi:hypothetical protein
MIVLLAACTFVFAACSKKEKNVDLPKEAIEIKIEEPTAGAVFHGGETVHIHANVKSDIQLHGYTLKLTDRETGTLLYEHEEHAHGKELTAHGSWANRVTATTEARLEVAVIIDHDGNTKNATVDITLHP